MNLWDAIEELLKEPARPRHIHQELQARGWRRDDIGYTLGLMLLAHRIQLHDGVLRRM